MSRPEEELEFFVKMEPKKREPYKPLQWRTGPVDEGMAVFFHYFLDGIGDDYDVGEGRDDGHIKGYYTIEWQDARWLPLSEILDLIGG